MTEPPIARFVCVCDFVLEVMQLDQPKTRCFQLTNVIVAAPWPEQNAEGIRSRSFDVYYQLTSGQGMAKIGISVGFVPDTMNNKVAYQVAHNDSVQEINFENPIDVHQGVFQIPDVPTMRLGDYQFTLTANGQPIADGSVNIIIKAEEVE